MGRGGTPTFYGSFRHRDLRVYSHLAEKLAPACESSKALRRRGSHQFLQ